MSNIELMKHKVCIIFLMVIISYSNVLLLTYNN